MERSDFWDTTQRPRYVPKASFLTGLHLTVQKGENKWAMGAIS
jgi:hypothetical protein